MVLPVLQGVIAGILRESAPAAEGKRKIPEESSKQAVQYF